MDWVRAAVGGAYNYGVRTRFDGHPRLSTGNRHPVSRATRQATLLWDNAMAEQRLERRQSGPIAPVHRGALISR